MRFKRMNLQLPTSKLRCTERGSTASSLPIILAFIFFTLFISLSIWFVSRSNKSNHVSHTSQTGSPFGSSTQPSPPSAPQLPAANMPAGFGNSSPLPPASSGSPSSQASPSPFGGSTPQPSNPQASSVDISQARNIVEAWLNYKKSVFAPPYDLSRIDEFVVNPGPLNSDIAKPGGSVDWLKSNRSAYRYNDLRILGVSDFRRFPDRAHLTVRILEDLELVTPRGIDRTKSGRKQQSWVYELKFHNGKWLVYDYRKDI